MANNGNNRPWSPLDHPDFPLDTMVIFPGGSKVILRFGGAENERVDFVNPQYPVVRVEDLNLRDPSLPPLNVVATQTDDPTHDLTPENPTQLANPPQLPNPPRLLGAMWNLMSPALAAIFSQQDP